MAIQSGDSFPQLPLLTDAGVPFDWASTAGKKVIVYFYPKADTPGCTTESCEFRDAVPDFSGIDAMVLGVSPDKPAAQAKFKEKYSLPFTLLCDPDHALAEACGVWVEKNMYGKKSMGLERSTFIIGPDGKVSKVYRKVKAAGHAEKVLAGMKG
ncbi:MAG: thioredoxin-dependent thiol peroxidase [Bryobacterales bacterium]|nr:thioredoxin-dependent thiol peroxidase [Bryobacterales bacterium]